MANVNNSPNMNLPIPAVGIESGPQWASDINASLTILDGHNHAPGSGVQITPNGLNINIDLPFNSHNATMLTSTQYISQTAPITSTYALQFVGKELVVNDGAGNNVQITLNGSVVGTPGSITGLTSPASASYSSSTFIFQSNVNVAANLDGASILLRLPTASSPALTLSPPSSMTANYTLTLPTVPTAASVMSMDTSGNMGTIPTVNLLVPSGSIIMTGATTAPTGYLLCDGSAVSRTTYAALYSAVGIAFGYGDNSTTFNLPDMRGAFVRGVTGTSTRDADASTRTASGTGGNTGNNVGSLQTDAIRNITGSKNDIQLRNGDQTATGAFYETYFSNQSYGGSGNVGVIGLGLDASLVVPVGSDNRPTNVYLNYIIKT